MKVQGDSAGEYCSHFNNAQPDNPKTPASPTEKPDEKPRDKAPDAKALDMLRKGQGSGSAPKTAVPLSPKKEQMLHDLPKPHPCTVPHKGPGIPCV